MTEMEKYRAGEPFNSAVLWQEMEDDATDSLLTGISGEDEPEQTEDATPQVPPSPFRERKSLLGYSAKAVQSGPYHGPEGPYVSQWTTKPHFLIRISYQGTSAYGIVPQGEQPNSTQQIFPDLRSARQYLQDNGFEYRKALSNYQSKAACGVGQNPARDKCTLSDGDSPTTQQSSSVTKKPEQGKQQAMRALLKEAGGKLLSYKDAVKEVSNRFGAEIWNKMPPKAQQRLAKTWIVAKAIEHKVMLGFTKAKELAKEAGSERGLDESQVEKLGKLLAVTDLALAWTVNMPATIAATGSLTAGKLASWVPIASLFYLSYSTARNPLATVRAAKKMIRSQAKHTKALDRDMTDVAKLLAEKLKTSSDPDWFMALYSAALDETGDPVKALKLAEQAFQSGEQE